MKIEIKAKEILGNTVSYLLIVYFSTITITKLFHFGGSTFLQIPEICFLLILPLCKFSIGPIRFTLIEKAVIFFILALILNLIFLFKQRNLLEIVGCLYLVAFFFIVSRLLADPEIRKKVIHWGTIGNVLVCSVVAIAAIVLHFYFDNHSLLRFYKDYPYFGDSWRLIGLSSNNLIITSLGMSVLIIPSLSMHRNVKAILIFISLLVCFLTLNKEFGILILILSILLYFNKIEKYISLKAYKFLYLILAVVFTFLTFFVARPSSIPYEKSKIFNPEQTTVQSLFSVADFDFHGTTYYYLFKNSVVAFLQNPLIGIGFNQLSYFIEEINAKSMYPSEMKVYGSHDLYWGPTAELGFLYLLFLVISIIGISKYLKTRRIEEANLHNSLGAVALFFGISFLISGSIQYRHLWIILALINSYYINSNMKLNTKADHE